MILLNHFETDFLLLQIIHVKYILSPHLVEPANSEKKERGVDQQAQAKS